MSGNGRVPSGGTALDGLSHAGIGKSVDGLARTRVANIQRMRMLGAMVREISERGVANVSVGHVVARSGVSRRTFYEIFEDREDCFLAAFDDALKNVAATVILAYEKPGQWHQRVRAGLEALLECLDCDRAMARLLIAESLAAGPRALERRQSVLAHIIQVIDEGRPEAKGGESLPPLIAEGVVGGVLSVLYARLTETSKVSLLIELTGPLMGMIVLPYLGSAAARREIQRPVPKQSGKHPQVRRNDPLHDLDMRLTYRTICVLGVVAEEPGSSNRHIGEAAEIGDQGQVSKLLARLQRLGLIHNTGIGAARGEPNAWQLTPKGTEVHDTITSVQS